MAVGLSCVFDAFHCFCVATAHFRVLLQLGSSILTAQEFKYGSARVILKSTSVDGICIGHFFYGTCQEIL